jgi:hypothetical protein
MDAIFDHHKIQIKIHSSFSLDSITMKSPSSLLLIVLASWWCTPIVMGFNLATTRGLIASPVSLGAARQFGVGAPRLSSSFDAAAPRTNSVVLYDTSGDDDGGTEDSSSDDEVTTDEPTPTKKSEKTEEKEKGGFRFDFLEYDGNYDNNDTERIEAYLGLKRGRVLEIIAVALAVWLFTIPAEFRRAKFCSELETTMYTECYTPKQWIGGVADYYKGGGGIAFDFSIDQKTLENNAALKNELFGEDGN